MCRTATFVFHRPTRCSALPIPSRDAVLPEEHPFSPSQDSPTSELSARRCNKSVSVSTAGPYVGGLSEHLFAASQPIDQQGNGDLAHEGPIDSNGSRPLTGLLHDRHLVPHLSRVQPRRQIQIGGIVRHEGVVLGVNGDEAPSSCPRRVYRGRQAVLDDVSRLSKLHSRSAPRPISFELDGRRTVEPRTSKAAAAHHLVAIFRRCLRERSQVVQPPCSQRVVPRRSFIEPTT